MLELPAIMRTLLRSTSVFLRYFKADWDKSEYINLIVYQAMIEERNAKNVPIIKKIIAKRKIKE